MQETKELKIEKLTSNNIDKIKSLYQNFMLVAKKDYKFELPPLDYEDLKEIIMADEVLKGYILFEDNVTKGFLFFVTESYQSIELNVIYLIDNQNLSKRKTALVKRLLDDFKDKTDWKVVSYPMLGVQDNFVKDVALLGFKMAGQAIVRFNFTNPLSMQILQKFQMKDLETGYSIINWEDKYFDQASQLIFDTFKTASDANFDPRFLSLDGSKQVVHNIVSGVFGKFLPEATSLLLYTDPVSQAGNVVGACFVNLSNAILANIPLVGVNSGHKGKGFGEHILKSSMDKVVRIISEGRIIAGEINAAVETDNFPALKMYRRIGFKEDYVYPHAYLKNPNYF